MVLAPLVAALSGGLHLGLDLLALGPEGGDACSLVVLHLGLEITDALWLGDLRSKPDIHRVDQG